MNRWKTMATAGALAMAAWVPSVGAQTTTPVPDPQVHQDRRELRRDQRDLRQDRHDMRQDARDIRQDKQVSAPTGKFATATGRPSDRTRSSFSRIGPRVTGPPFSRIARTSAAPARSSAPISATSTTIAAISTRTEETSAPTIAIGVMIVAR
jgi:hypothetical protein